MSTRPVVSNSSPLIAPEAIGELALLDAIFPSRVCIPEAVAREVASSVALPAWLSVRTLSQPLAPAVLRDSLGPGGREAICLALELQAEALVMDDLTARNLADRLGVQVVGTVGVIIQAKRQGVLKAARPYLEQLRATGLYISDHLLERALELAGE